MLSTYIFLIGRLNKLYKLYKEGELWEAGLWLTFANIMGGVLGYAYQVIMGRLLTPSEFGLFSAIIALSMFFMSPLTAFSLVVSREVSALKAHGNISRLRALYFIVHKIVFFAWLGLFFAYVIFSDSLQKYLSSPTPTPVLIFVVSILFGCFLTINSAFFQGEKKFGFLGLANIIAIFMKIVFSAIFIYCGMRVSGALLGGSLATAMLWFVGMILILGKYLGVRNDKSCETILSVNSFKAFIPVLVANICFVGMTQLDLVLVNWYFPSSEVGVYAAASVLGKIVLYLPGGLVMALYPIVAESHALKKDTHHFALQTLLMTFVICGLAAITLFLFGEKIILILYGDNYIAGGSLLKWYGFAMLPMALVTVLEHFLIAKGRTLFVWIFLLVCPLQLWSISIWHDHLYQILISIGVSGIFVLIVGCFYLFRRNLKK